MLFFMYSSQGEDNVPHDPVGDHPQLKLNYHVSRLRAALIAYFQSSDTRENETWWSESLLFELVCQ